MGGIRRVLPSRVCFCAPFNIGTQVLLIIIILLRIAGMVCGCFYGPYLYLVVSLGGLYLSADFLILYTVFWKGEKNDDCEYPTQRIWIILWQAMNAFAIIGLLVAIGWFSNLGTWAMLHDPIHFVVFILIIILDILLIYTGLIIYTLSLFLHETYLDNVLGKCGEIEEEAGLTSGGRRVSI
ncbi:uncharacterized protein LOC111709144 [Eurytemora carolleeae]|uniref:uncharacterized protein LOC111709144 n=1 Tax=Eurytemora carolleeae TaxID=1294199 RepID=UPI000C76430E|nr:uncharacterized protein LOC111709144 [Eurytemora carolleeae]|eukprot:XP_023338520.1 uncharacterized protein LOC111709144 [Eurytemora affinis]